MELTASNRVNIMALTRMVSEGSGSIMSSPVKVNNPGSTIFTELMDLVAGSRLAVTNGGTMMPLLGDVVKNMLGGTVYPDPGTNMLTPVTFKPVMAGTKL